MPWRYELACFVTVAAALVLTVLQLGNLSYGVVLCIAVLVALALFLLCGFKRQKSIAVAGVPAQLTAGAAALTGMAMLVSGISDSLDLLGGKYPYPQPLSVTFAGKLLVYMMLAGAIGGGLFFLWLAVRSFSERRVESGQFGVISLLPVVWLWGKLLWYMTSFVSATDRFRASIEVAMMLFEMLFLLSFARYVSGVEEKEPRFAVPLALCTAFFGLSSCMTRFSSFVLQDAQTFSATALVSSPDLGIVLLALLFVVSQRFCKPAPPQPVFEAEEEPVTPQETVEDDSFLLTEEVFMQQQEVHEEPIASETERRPLELEDILNEIMNGNV